MNEIEFTIPGREHSLGGFSVKRVLPFPQKRTVGPFVFMDHMGPYIFSQGNGLSISPHPHIGLSTLTYLLEGRILHRDSLGSEIIIQPGEVNWMTAGKGVAHSERSVESDLAGEHRLHGLQLWVALPDDQEDREPSFHNFKNEELPRVTLGNCECTIIAGTVHGKSSPVPVYSPLFFLDVKAPEGSHFTFDPDGQDIAIYVTKGRVQVNQQDLAVGSMSVFKPGSNLEFKSSVDSRAFILGGKPFPNEKHMWWNFVSSSKEKIEAAKVRWESEEPHNVKNESKSNRAPLPRA